jgi:hypothetical protein
LIGRRPDLGLKKNHRPGSGLSKHGMAWPIPNLNGEYEIYLEEKSQEKKWKIAKVLKKH